MATCKLTWQTRASNISLQGKRCPSVSSWASTILKVRSHSNRRLRPQSSLRTCAFKRLHLRLSLSDLPLRSLTSRLEQIWRSPCSRDSSWSRIPLESPSVIWSVIPLARCSSALQLRQKYRKMTKASKTVKSIRLWHKFQMHSGEMIVSCSWRRTKIQNKMRSDAEGYFAF